jgi:stage III sporulation protein SpoIIIAA
MGMMRRRAAPCTALASGSSGDAWSDELEELDRLFGLLPPSVRSSLEDHGEMTEALEIVMDLGRPALARFPSGDVKLSSSVVTREDLAYAVKQVGEFGGDNRAGIDRTLHRISAIRNRRGDVIGLTCRVGRAIAGSADLVADLITSGSSILFLGRPGVGKTTTIREVCRTLSDVLEKRVVSPFGF